MINHQAAASRPIRPTHFLTVYFLLMTLAACAAETVTTPFRGVRYIHRTETAPRLLDIHIVELDLRDPAIRFTVTKPNGPKTPGETTIETTRHFAARVKAQLAINTSFYSIKTIPYVDNLNVAVSNGVKYSTFTLNQPALNISRDNVATIVEHAPGDKTGYVPVPRVKLWNTFGGNERILRGGAVVAHDHNLHPRTAAGVSADHKKLWLLVVDGRNPLHSMGMTTIEVAEMLKHYGAVDALNLDGGGSSTLVFANPAPRVVNITVGLKDIPFTERPVGMNLGIYAAAAGAKTEKTPRVAKTGIAARAKKENIKKKIALTNSAN